jgi:hypothetical protein
MDKQIVQPEQEVCQGDDTEDLVEVVGVFVGGQFVDILGVDL